VAKVIREAQGEFSKIGDSNENPVFNLEAQLRGHISLNKGKWGLQYYQGIIDNTNDPEEEWKARWKMFTIDRERINLERSIREAREKADKMALHSVVSNEQHTVFQTLSSHLEYCQDNLKTLEEKVREAGGQDKVSKDERNKVLKLRKDARIYGKACETYKREHNVTATERPKYYDGEIDLRERLWHFMTSLEGSRDEVAALREFLADMPDNVKGARVEAESCLKRESNARQQALMEIEKFEGLLRAAGYEGWPLDRRVS
jgi:chromosome segregation ATPase